MTQADKARAFAALHRKGDPVVLYNIWDAGGAATLAKAGAPALATGSWSVAAAQGYADGEELPLDLLLTVAARICASVEVPVTIDFEGGYAEDPDAVAANVKRLMETGAIGLNFEDRVVQGSGLYSVADQAARIKAVRAMADAAGIPLFINARTDLFLANPLNTHDAHIDDALDRAAAYAAAGASGFFVPGLTDDGLIRQITAAVDLPVNVMMMGPLSSPSQVAALGVARASYGPGPYRTAQSDLKARYAAL